MSDWPAGTQLAQGASNRAFLSTAAPESALYGHLITTANHIGGVAVWPSANLALYCPVLVVEPFVVVRMATWVGTSAAGNIDLGIYNEAGTRLVSTGSTAIGSAGPQLVSVSTTTLSPGVFFFAMNCSTVTTATFARSNLAAVSLRTCGMQQEAVGSVTLPSTATFAAMAQAYAPNITAHSKTVM